MTNSVFWFSFEMFIVYLFNIFGILKLYFQHKLCENETKRMNFEVILCVITFAKSLNH